MATVGMAVLGCGRIGRLHARNLARHARVRLAAVFDVSAEAAQQTAAELGVRSARTVEELWDDRNVRAVVIATPTDTHVPLIVAAVKAGKAVFCEKPIDMSLERARACWNEIAADHPLVMIGFNRRFDPSYRALRERLKLGEIGRLELAVITSRDPAPPPVGYLQSSGGLFRDMTIHDFDMARYLAGDIAKVHAFGANLVDAEIGKLGDIDTCALSLRAKSGALIQINNSRRCVYGYDQRIEAFGPGGMLQAGNRHETSVAAWNGERTGGRDLVLHSFIERYAQAYESEMDAFVNALAEGRPMSPDFHDGVEALRLAVAAGESLRTGRVVDVGG
ncbi:MAG TPA: inositol 2-dehydrogenase [Steroidobacteraceae bacterium]|jgi:myo-inositol 2-dehydrogenase/D-chiro-inositol 1-dehydrogenase|nr:inositol 2-dehydrogenase [Steroidobacteraceae bacterium]